ncbi:MAG TPA: hypothetical protein VNI52_06250 [Sphingobacteriaceae bacterium]|nr:hypothetical protein [Sphingobacteriaceae bacterium]
MSKFPSSFLEKNRLFEVLYQSLPGAIRKADLYGEMTDYLEKYIRDNHLSEDDIDLIYRRFITNYNFCSKKFLAEGKYPHELGIDVHHPNRIEYDVILMLSTILNSHRFRIMEIISEVDWSDHALFVGVGSGLELHLRNGKHREIQAFDISINPHLIMNLPKVKFSESYYSNHFNVYFDAVFLIEILEHLSDPWSLIDIAAKSCKIGGQIYLTTATNIPQFDHLFNFPEDHSEFEKYIKSRGFEIQNKEKINHRHLTINLQSSNHFYIIKKLRNY